MTENQDIEVHAFWDEEAGAWVAESDQTPSLVTEAETLEQLALELEGLIPELLELNVAKLDGVPAVNLRAERILYTVSYDESGSPVQFTQLTSTTVPPQKLVFEPLASLLEVMEKER